MNQRQAKRLFKKHLPHLRWAMQLQDWDVTAVWGPMEPVDGASRWSPIAVCTTDPKYRRATIELDHNQLESEQHLLEVLLHELAHVIHADLQTYRRCVMEHVSGKAFEALDIVYQHTVERIVWNIEQMLKNGLGLTPAAMMDTAERHWRKRRGK